MERQEPEWSARIQKSLSRLDGIEVRLTGLREPQPGSQAAVDCALRHGSLAWSFAGAALQVAFDHLRTWRHQHGAGLQPAFGHWTLIRASVEAAATARWPCEPGANAVARGIGAERADLLERKGFEARLAKAMPWAPAPRVAADHHLAGLSGAGIRGEGTPDSTDLVRRYLPPAPLANVSIDSVVLYKALSSIAHAKMWAMPILGDAVRGDPVTGAPELAATTVSAPSGIVWLVSNWAVTSLDLAVRDMERYSGV